MAIVAIDAGHGKKTSGKRCLKKLDPKETREWVLNNNVAKYVNSYLRSYGHSTFRVDDPTGAKDVPLVDRVSRAKKGKADFYISVHHDSGIGGGTGGGTTTFRNTAASVKSKKTQEAIYKRAIQYGKLKGNRSNGVRTADFYVVRETPMPAVLIECGFMDSKADIEYILDPKWSKKIAKGIALGICDIYGKKKIPAITKKKYSGKLPTATVNRKAGTKANTKRWQEFLNWYGYPTKIDGDFGPDTERQTKVAQKAMGFTGKAIDGSAGPDTRAKAAIVKK